MEKIMGISEYDTKAHLIQNNYLIVDEFISKEETESLHAAFKAEAAANPDKYVIDPEGTKSIGIYNFIPFVQLLVDKVPVIKSIVKEDVLPTNCYARLYKHGAELPKHADRTACEISVTLHLGSDGTEWPIYFTDPRGTQVEIKLKPGQAAVYLGIQSVHWRNKFEGQQYAQVFLHYVRTYGENSEHYFDSVAKNPIRIQP
jgi:hypothetical protein